MNDDVEFAKAATRPLTDPRAAFSQRTPGA